MAKKKEPLEPVIDMLLSLDTVIEKAVKRVAENERRSFARTVSTWKNKPNFKLKKVSRKYHDTKIIGYEIYTDSIIWKWVDEGTKSHPIEPKYSPYLWYGTKWQSKTVPDKIGARKGIPKSAPYWVGLDGQGVSHPGVKARNFTENILDKADERLEKAVTTEIQKAVRKMKS